MGCNKPVFSFLLCFLERRLTEGKLYLYHEYRKSGSQPKGGEASVYAASQRFAPFFMYRRKKQVVQGNAVNMRG